MPPTRRNHERVLADVMLHQKTGKWHDPVNWEGPRYRLHARKSKFIADGVSDFDGSKTFGPFELIKIHTETNCGNKYPGARPCVIHNPTSHFFSDKPLVWDMARAQFFRLCDHDIPHPDPDDVTYWVTEAKVKGKVIHTCCMECFPQGKCCTVVDGDLKFSYARTFPTQ